MVILTPHIVQAHASCTNSLDWWYSNSGIILDPKAVGQDWADLLLACKGLIAFDAALCRGPSHTISSRPKIANVSLEPCAGCGSAPEGVAKPGVSPVDELPLVAPVPVCSSSVRAAQMPMGGGREGFVARCEACLGGRWCAGCNRWWCEGCFQIDEGGAGGGLGGSGRAIKVHRGLCVDRCLVEELYIGGGEGGMWG